MTESTLNIIGAGKAGRVMARLFCDNEQFRVCQVLNTSMESSISAIDFIGQGEALADWAQLQPADAWMIASSDASIASLAERLANSGLVRQGQLVFHLSGVLGADVFAKLQQRGANAASVHPLKTFPDPEAAYRCFGQPFCALEGDDTACQALQLKLQAIGARSIRLASDQKVLYHAANTMLCNYLLALLDSGLNCYQQAGIDASQALEMVAPLLRETLENGLAMGPANAMTGPLLRGDGETVASHLQEIPALDRDVYRSLGLHVLQMAESAGRLSAARLGELRQILQ